MKKILAFGIAQSCFILTGALIQEESATGYQATSIQNTNSLDLCPCNHFFSADSSNICSKFAVKKSLKTFAGALLASVSNCECKGDFSIIDNKPRHKYDMNIIDSNHNILDTILYSNVSAHNSFIKTVRSLTVGNESFEKAKKSKELSIVLLLKNSTSAYKESDPQIKISFQLDNVNSTVARNNLQKFYNLCVSQKSIPYHDLNTAHIIDNVLKSKNKTYRILNSRTDISALNKHSSDKNVPFVKRDNNSNDSKNNNAGNSRSYKKYKKNTINPKTYKLIENDLMRLMKIEENKNLNKILAYINTDSQNNSQDANLNVSNNENNENDKNNDTNNNTIDNENNENSSDDTNNESREKETNAENNMEKNEENNVENKVEGQICENNQLMCDESDKYSYKHCFNNSWVIRKNPPGTKCIQDGNSISFGFSDNSN
ncbi:hypothetical protein BB561_001672 [Smittium simulii]|uniref:Uncharacterized protein n=1 Tax=Smittium simulii TaxID=133385 RepID=A0A2T9YTK0_9FUNG|nr:hypothetical protein BB561_001672 [Smittium simulii]